MDHGDARLFICLLLFNRRQPVCNLKVFLLDGLCVHMQVKGGGAPYEACGATKSRSGDTESHKGQKRVRTWPALMAVYALARASRRPDRWHCQDNIDVSQLFMSMQFCMDVAWRTSVPSALVCLPAC